MEKEKSEHKLSELFATAICGNDILSSTLYVSGIAALFAGIWAPIVLLLVALVLQLFRKVYTEVVEALPINGGAYNALLNSTSKSVAALAGVMTILSYIATAVISAKIAIEYIFKAIEVAGYNISENYVIPITIALLLSFALLVIGGIKDSAKVALSIFVFHIFTLTLFVILGIEHIYHIGLTVFIHNYTITKDLILNNGGLIKTLFFGFSASLLGVSGFESSANFVEEQKKGVFRKTLKNMAFGVLIFNPLIAFIIVGSVDHSVIIAAKDFLLATAANVVGGNFFQMMVGVDAFLVLSGAVLTAYVGVSGLVSRMSSDNCLPEFVNKENKKGSFPIIISSFFILCSSILILTKGNLLSLAGVYTISFLGVMTLFAAGNILLKETRTELKRTYYAPVYIVALAGLATAIGMYGNIKLDPKNLDYFATYFIPTFLLVMLMVYQESIARNIVNFSRKKGLFINFIEDHFLRLSQGHYIVFIRNIANIHTSLEYLTRNENGHNVTFIYCDEGRKTTTLKKLKEIVPFLQKAGVYPYFNIKVIGIKKKFGPEAIEYVSKKLDVPYNKILIGSIHSKHEFDYSDLNGVRIIFS